MIFKLTQKHINQGYLDAGDFNTTLGQDVEIFSHAQFPHYHELAREHRLPEPLLEERSHAMYTAFSAASHGLVRQYTASEIDDLGRTLHSKVLSNKRRLSHGLFSDPSRDFHHFKEIQEKGFIDAHTEPSDLFLYGISGNQVYVLPGLFNEPVKVEYYTFVVAAQMLLSREMNARYYWARHTGIKPGALENYPDDHAHVLSEDLHERRHLEQIALEPFKYDERDDDPSFFEQFIQPIAAKYYLELDADMAAKASLSKANVGHETSVAQKHSRYLHLLTGPSLYWFAPAQDALEKQKAPRDFPTIYATIMEIRMRLMMQRNGIDHKIYTSDDLQGEITGAVNLVREDYWAQRTHHLNKQYHQYVRAQPENLIVLLTNLRQLQDQGTFSNPFTREIVSKIIDAAHYFNPDLLLADHTPNRRSLEKHYNGPVYS